MAGQYLRDAVGKTDELWAEALRQQKIPSQFEDQDGKIDLAFFGPNTLLNQDQGIRTLLHILNDICIVRVDELSLHQWGDSQDVYGSEEEQVSVWITSLKKVTKISKFLKELASVLAKYDWRSSSGPELIDEERMLKAGFRGSGGYKALRGHVLIHLASSSGDVALAAKEVIKYLGY